MVLPGFASLVIGIICSLLIVEPAVSRSASSAVSLVANTSGSVEFSVNATARSSQLSISEGDTALLYSIPNEGFLYLPGRPLLPAISRFVVVPPDKGLELLITNDEPSSIPAAFPPALCEDNEVSGAGVDLIESDEGIFPSVIAEMSEPVVMRGIRLVKVTTYPVRYNRRSNSYLLYDHIQAEIRSNNSAPVNPATHPNRRQRSREFLNYLDALVLNSDLPDRDNPSFTSPYRGHYLIVTHVNCFPYARPLIEWRRKNGYKVDILSLNANDALNENTIKNRIQERYDAYLDQGLDPFDNILLIGNRNFYLEEHNPPWVLNSFDGESIWQNDAKHADYKFGCLEGNDNWPDVAFSRFGSGTQNLMELAVGRTLSYEMNPYMDDPSWFTRGCVYSQHWGNDANTAWHPSIHTNARWGEELLKRYGYDDITFYENYEWDEWGEELGPVLTDVFNNGANLLIGRSQNYYWRYNFNGVNNHHVFPINIFISGHGEGPADMMFRTGSGNDLKGTVASCFGWGNPATLPMNYIWLDIVRGVVVEKLTLGWAKNLAITSIESIFPNIQVVGQNLYLHAKSDIDSYGDPAIKPWFGVPRLVDVEVPARISAETRRIEIRVVSNENGEPVAGAQVTFYDPGNMPAAAADYLAYDEMFTLLESTDASGRAVFILPENQPIGEGGTIYLTVTGDDIRPNISTIRVSEADFDPEILTFELNETEGNGDGLVNPGETFELSLTVSNNGNAEIDSLNAIVSSPSPWIEVIDGQIPIGSLETGRGKEGDAPATFRLSADCPDGMMRQDLRSELLIVLANEADSIESGIQLDPRSPCYSLESLAGGFTLARGENNISPVIRNVGRITGEPLTARLISRWQDIQLVQGMSAYGRINPDRTGNITADIFRVDVNDQVVPGTSYDLMLALSSQTGFRDTVRFVVQVEAPDANTPTGPDKYGYSCFDDSDNGWDATPVYEWIEINPNDDGAEFEGSELDFNRQSEFNIGEAIVVEIGFHTNFYGLPFDHITVASNGFIAMGRQPRITNFQNWPLDKAIGGGMGMLAPLWDDLRFSQASWIGTYLDENEHRLIIEWYRMRPATGDVDFTFQVILYDSEHYRTLDGNQPILFQYKTVSGITNIRNGDREWITNTPYASVGISSPYGDTGVNYVWNNTYPVSSGRLQNRRALKFVSHGQAIATGFMYGRVVDLANGEPIEGAMLTTQTGINVSTDGEGYWSCVSPANVLFTLTAAADGYNDSTAVELSIDEADTLEVNFALTHPEMVLSRNRFDGELVVGEEVQLPFTISNRGNGPLRWRTEKQLVGGGGSPWDSTASFHCGQRVGDTRIEGVVFVDDRFYVSGANDADPNWIYILDREGEPVGGFEQPGVSIYGMKDLDWDGELIWGSGTDQIFGFDVEGNSVDTLPSPVNPAVGIAWDSDRDLIWLCGVVSRIFGIDRDGNLVTTLAADNLRKYGLAYWAEDPDGAGLYIFTRDAADGRQCVWRTNPDEDQFSRVTFLEPAEGGQSGGACITNEFDPLHTTFLCISNTDVNAGGDRIDAYLLNENLNWMSLDVAGGELGPEEAIECTLTLSDGGLPTGEYEGRIAFYLTESGGYAELPVLLAIVAEGESIRRLALAAGWNLVSLNVEPEVADIRQMFSELVEADNLLLIKDGIGRFYRPDANFSNLLPWSAALGYQVALREQTVLSVRGVVVAPETPISLSAGWNMIGYYPRQSLPPEEALAGIVDHLMIAKNGYGCFYLPQYGFSNMESMDEGKGYQLRMSEDADLIYRGGGRMSVAPTQPVRTTHFICDQLSNLNMSLLVIADRSYQGREIGAFDLTGNIAGAGMFDNSGRCGLAIWGRDSLFNNSRGLYDGEGYNLRIWDGVKEESLSLKTLNCNLIFESNGITVIDVTTQTPSQINMEDPYPNPFNFCTHISFSLPEATEIRLGIYDLTGREIALLLNGQISAGRHRIQWNGKNANGIPATSGVYLLRLETPSGVKVSKMTLVK